MITMRRQVGGETKCSLLKDKDAFDREELEQVRDESQPSCEVLSARGYLTVYNLRMNPCFVAHGVLKAPSVNQYAICSNDRSAISGK